MMLATMTLLVEPATPQMGHLLAVEKAAAVAVAVAVLTQTNAAAVLPLAAGGDGKPVDLGPWASKASRKQRMRRKLKWVFIFMTQLRKQTRGVPTLPQARLVPLDAQEREEDPLRPLRSRNRRL